MSRLLNSLPAGSLIKLNENGVAIPFIVLQYNHYGMGEVTVLRQKTYGIVPFSYGWISGSKYEQSTSYTGNALDLFCNIQYPLKLDPVIQACLIEVPITLRGIMRKGFALSDMEVVGATGTSGDGTAFNYLSSSPANRIAIYELSGSAGRWWLRTSHKTTNHVGVIEYNGNFGSGIACNANSSGHPRPALTLSGNILASNNPDSSGCYTIDDAVIAGEGYHKVNGTWRRTV